MIKRPSALDFEQVVLEDESYFIEAAAGYYNILIIKDYIDEPGTYILSLSHYITTMSFGDIEESKEAVPAPIYSASNSDTCLVTGNVGTVGGSIEPYSNVAISAVPVKLPSETSGVITLGTKLQVYADYQGYFAMPLVKGMEVIFEIRAAGVRFQALIPDLPTIRIEDLMPKEDPLPEPVY